MLYYAPFGTSPTRCELRAISNEYSDPIHTANSDLRAGELRWSPLVMAASASDKTSSLPTTGGHDSLVDFVVERIVEDVRSGRYSPGQRLIAAELANELGVSRAPIREALHVLSGEGVVDLVPNRGARIRDFSPEQLADFLDFTNAVCSLGVELTTRKISDPRIASDLKKAYQKLKPAADKRDAVRFVNALYALHREINRLSGNEFIDTFYARPAFSFFVRFLAQSIPGAHWDRYISNYEKIYESIMSGDPERATRQFSSHLKWAKSLLSL